MRPNRTHLLSLAAALSTIAIAAPVSTAAADTPSPAVPVAAAGQPATVVGPRIITDGTATFTNLKIVTASGNATS